MMTEARVKVIQTQIQKREEKAKAKAKGTQIQNPEHLEEGRVILSHPDSCLEEERF